MNRKQISGVFRAAQPGERTLLDLVREYVPDASVEEVDDLLWNETPFPLVSGDALRPYLQRVNHEH